jgi:hypothetical protein
MSISQKASFVQALELYKAELESGVVSLPTSFAELQNFLIRSIWHVVINAEQLSTPIFLPDLIAVRDAFFDLPLVGSRIEGAVCGGAPEVCRDDCLENPVNCLQNATPESVEVPIPTQI